MEQISYFTYDDQGKPKDIDRSLVDEFLLTGSMVFVKCSMPMSKATRAELKKELPNERYHLGYPGKTERFFIAQISSLELNNQTDYLSGITVAESIPDDTNQTKSM